ncbi:putative heat shock protein 70 family protein [Tanacetum coccineum]
MDGSGNDAPAIGIDLGTTYSCVAVWKHNRVEIIPNDQGNRTTPSYVSFVDDERLIGDGAKNQVAMKPANTIFDAKRLIGRRFSDPKVQDDLKLWPFRVIEGPADTPKIALTYKGEEREFLAEEISAMLLSNMKEIAETYIGKAVKDLVITVPAYFNDSQRQATKNAGIIAGLNILSMINEPTAAAIAYGLDNKFAINGKINVLVFDLGGGTFDISLMTIEDKGTFNVKAVSGDTRLGGEDFDNHMVNHCVREFKRKWDKDLTGNQRALGRLRFACEKAKRILSSTSQTSIELDCLHEGIDFSLKFTRAKFEELNMNLFDKCIKTIDMCLHDAKIQKSWVDEIILVGGSTRIPMVQRMLQELFDGKELCKSVNPDEAVAYGAAVMAAKLRGHSDKKVRDLLLLDVTPLSLGVHTAGKVFDVVIPRNTQIPTKRTKIYTTVKDNQSSLTVKVYQGERAKSTDNHLLGELRVLEVPLAHPRVKVCFEIDSNGILTVTSEILSTHKRQKLTITNVNGRLSENEIKKMLKDCEQYQNEDKEFKMKAEAHYELDNLIYDVKKKIKERNIKTRMHPESLIKMENAIAETTQWLHDNKDASLAELKEMKFNISCHINIL